MNKVDADKFVQCLFKCLEFFLKINYLYSISGNIEKLMTDENLGIRINGKRYTLQSLIQKPDTVAQLFAGIKSVQLN